MATARGERWSSQELELAVAEYFEMLRRELRGERYVKARHVRALQTRLRGRTKAAVEMRLQNISAALLQLNWPWIDGYKPLTHGGALVAPFVRELVEGDVQLSQLVRRAVDAPMPVDDLQKSRLQRVSPPVARPAPGTGHESPPSGSRRPRGPIDYLAREARNASLGRAGELLVCEFERLRLSAAKRDDLARRVRHVSMEDEGLGFDVLSFNEDESERCVEVKSTAYGAEAPFFVTRRERDVSIELEDRYHLYRVFRLRADPRFFVLSGSLGRTCLLEPESFRARVA